MRPVPEMNHVLRQNTTGDSCIGFQVLCGSARLVSLITFASVVLLPKRPYFFSRKGVLWQRTQGIRRQEQLRLRRVIRSDGRTDAITSKWISIFSICGEPIT